MSLVVSDSVSGPQSRRAGSLSLPWPGTCALTGAAVALGVIREVPLGGDAAAHLYRALLVNHGALVWDNFWYGGQYPLASYSVLYYWPAALVGNGWVVVVAVAAGSALFGSVVGRQWREAGRWPALLFAATAGLVPATGEYPFLVGIASGLATLFLLQRSRPMAAGVLVAITIALSPLAFVFLALALSAVGLVRRSAGPKSFLPTAAAGVCLVAVVLYVSAAPWVAYPFTLSELGFGLLLAASGCALVLGTPRGQPLAVFFLLWGLAIGFLYVVPSPVGADVLRLREFSLPLVLLAVTLSGRRRWFLAPLAVGLALLSARAIYQPAYAGLVSGGNARMTLWRPALTFLRSQSTLGFRIEVVPTAGHWEAYYFPRAGYPLARGWYRQLDLALNHILYSQSLSPFRYRRWLDARAVRFVLLPHRVGLDGSGARAEARLLSSGQSGLRQVFDRDGWTIYAVQDPTPILSGRSASALTVFGHDRIEGWLETTGRYRLLVRYTPAWSSSPSVCVSPGEDGMSTLVALRPGRFTLAASIDGLIDGHSPCPASRPR